MKFLGLAVFCVGLHAQWMHYPTPGVPRTPTGEPNLTAPVPRAGNGKPDLSGLWIAEANRPCPKDGCFDQKIGEQFIDLGAEIKGGLPYQKWAVDLVKARKDDNGKDDITTKCLPLGVPRGHMNPTYKKLVQTPGLLLILDEHNMTFRQIFLDGRPLPMDPNPAFNGYSTGRWDGDVLVVETNGLRDQMWLDRNGSPITDAAKVTERFHRLNFGHLEVEITVNDPKAYTVPWTTKIRQVIEVDSDLLEFVCSENDKDPPHLVGK